MKIGYITKQDPLDKKAYSGTHYYMYRALPENFEEVVPLGPIDTRFKIIPKIEGRLLRLYSGKIYKYQYNLALARRMSGIIDDKIKRSAPDVVLASLMTPEVAYLKSKVPLYITTDATFPLLNEVYGSHTNLHPKSIREATNLEQRAFERAKKLILPLQWLADSAMKEYGIKANRIEVISYGANLDLDLSKEEVKGFIENRIQSKKTNLLFVGVRWKEKGGPFAVEVLNELLNKGVDAELEIVGCEPEISEQPNEVKVIGFLDKERDDEAERLFQLYSKASFFIMPTQAECVGMSFIEAASFGLPAIGSDIGGVSEAVIHDKTGCIISEQMSAEEVADWIIKVQRNEDRYRSLSEEAYAGYSKKMNWKRWGDQVREVINY